MALSICLSIILGVLTLDQITKLLLMNTRINIISKVITIDPRLNDGAAFSSLSGARVFFIIFTMLALVFMFYILVKKIWSRHSFFRITLSIMIGGVIGNFIDRIFLGSVRDFLCFPFLGFVCNVADIAITVACVMFVIYIFFLHDKHEHDLKIESINSTKEGNQ